MLFLLLTTVLVTAFTQKSNSAAKPAIKSNLYVYYFSYIGPTSPFSFSDYVDPNNYVILDEPDIMPREICEPGMDAVCLILCERYWNGFEWKPDFSDTTQGSAYWGLNNFFYSGVTTTNTVYLKDL